MDFDFDQIAVPFRMQPGLRRMPPDSLRLTPLDPCGQLYAEKKAVFEAGHSRHLVAGFDPAAAIAAIQAQAAIPGLHGSLLVDLQAAIELAFEEDFVVLDGASGTVPWLCVCVPSHWVPEAKLGLDFTAIHAPVADSAALLAAARQLVGLVTAGDCWERHVWTVSPSPRYDQHPARHPRTPWPATADLQAFARQCWLRVERQSFFPVGPEAPQQAVFAIRVMLQPLTQIVRTPRQAGRLHDSLASMSQAVLDYKGLSGARDRLLQWLEAGC